MAVGLGAEMTTQLVPMDGGDAITVTEELILIGRGDNCDLKLTHTSVSRAHCVVARLGDRVLVRDLGSSNGTWINGKRVERGILVANDMLLVAGVRFKVEFQDPATQKPEAALPPVEESTSNNEIGVRRQERPDRITAHWKPGLEVFDGCHLLDRIGEGGFGEVWKAEKVGFGPLALKKIRLVDPVRNEARALEAMQGLRHQYLIRVFGYRRKEDILVVALELGDETLLQRFNQYRRQGLVGIPQEELIAYLGQVAEALDYLYFTRKLLHRDIKPSNILLVGKVAKLCDFGLAKVLRDASASHSGIATFEFAPPEFFDGKMVASSDQFSLAVSYCFLLMGEKPFPGPDVRAILAQHVSGNPKLDFMPPAQRPVLKKALARNPAERYGSSVHFVSALHDAIVAAHSSA